VKVLLTLSDFAFAKSAPGAKQGGGGRDRRSGRDRSNSPGR
jgi:hypothetical protein